MFITMYGVVSVGAIATTFHAFFSNEKDAQAYIDSDMGKDRFWSAEIRLFQIGDVKDVS